MSDIFQRAVDLFSPSTTACVLRRSAGTKGGRCKVNVCGGVGDRGIFRAKGKAELVEMSRATFQSSIFPAFLSASVKSQIHTHTHTSM